ncbi:MAG TPA: helix-turn-helix domain-containing protein [Bacteroidia bacterium]|jgi:energy-coupling factor transporter ATP-binding protein EcfA2|nr:helix-turn-helix domain-containing protein [Bacteroidia bacterium]
MASQITLSENALLAVKFINHTHKNVFLTGKAGTGKTTLLKHIIENTHKKTLVAAPTGIAAINAGGVTIHSLFQLPFGSFVPFNQQGSAFSSAFKMTDPASLIKNQQMGENKRQLLRELELLVIDEVSMLRADLLDAIDVVLKYVRRKNYAPFGGVQVLFIGDLLQLPPVVKNEEWSVLKEYYKSPWFFDARALQLEKPVYIELDKIYRQDEAGFISLLNNLRNNCVTTDDISLLNTFYKPGFKPSPKENYITLTTHNNKAAAINGSFLNELKTKSHFFEAEVKDEFSEFSFPVDKSLELKKGAQVMFVKNDPSGQQRFFNGKIGVVSDLSSEKIEVEFEDGSDPVEVEKYKWENIKYSLNETTKEVVENIAGSFTQYPLKTAWAITVHKSQGLTFDKAIIDIADAFAPGQIYVALSRLRSLQGLVLTSKVNFSSLAQDEKVSEFSKTKSVQENPNELVKKETLLFLQSYLLQCFNFSDLTDSFNEHAASYTKSEKLSGKQKHRKWADELTKQVIDLKTHADNFSQQLIRVFSNKETNYLELITKRVTEADTYFNSQLKKIASVVLAQVEKLNSEKKVRKYLTELVKLEPLPYTQIKKINKAVAFCKSIQSDTAFDKQEVNKSVNDVPRVQQLQDILANPEQEKKKKERSNRRKREKETGIKEPKPDTKLESLKLYKQGKMPEEIAKERNLTVGTIEGHLVTFVAKGQLSALEFVSRDKIRSILTASKKLDTMIPGSLKQALGDEFTYGEIRMTIAGLMAEEYSR